MTAFLDFYFSTWTPWIVSGVAFAYLMWVSYKAGKQKGNKKKKFNPKMFGWALLIGANIFLVTYVNPAWLGYGYMTWASSLHVTDDKVYLFDSLISNNPEASTGTQSSTPYLRMHVIDKQKKERLSRDLLGANYDNIWVGNNLFIAKANIVRGSYTGIAGIYDLEEDGSLTPLFIKGEEAEIDGRPHKVFELSYFDNYIKVTTNDASEYYYHAERGTFVDGVPEFEQPKFRYILTGVQGKQGVSGIRTSWENEPNSEARYEFIHAKVVNEDENYCVVYHAADLEREAYELSVVDIKGNMKLQLTEKMIAGDAGADEGTIQRTLIYNDELYLTSGRYLLVYDILEGSLLWSLAL